MLTLDANFTTVVGLRAEVLLQCNGRTENLVSHVHDQGTVIRAIGKVEPGKYQVLIAFHVIADQNNETITSPHKKVKIACECMNLGEQC